MATADLLKRLPSVDECLRSPAGAGWLTRAPRPYVLQAVRAVLDSWRAEILAGERHGISDTELETAVMAELGRLTPLSLRPVINATGVVIHTNLGRSPLSEAAIENVARVARGYSTLEYDIERGERGSRHAHVARALREVTGAEAGIVVNNNAGAVLLCLAALAHGREVVVSRGELVEIGGSFRVPEVMAASGALLREVGATNKTHPRDYEAAITPETALLLKVHRSNFSIKGFTSDVALEDLAAMGHARGIPVMFDLGSGSLADLRAIGARDEHPVQQVLRTGVDVVTFSGDKLLGGPQAGLIVGKGELIARIQRHPLMRALRIDKLTLAALEATLRQYVEPERARREIPTLRMLLEAPASVRRRARRIARALGALASVDARVVADEGYPGGGALPEHPIPTFVVELRVEGLSPNELDARLRAADPPVIGRIREGVYVLDARTIAPDEINSPGLAGAVSEAVGRR